MFYGMDYFHYFSNTFWDNNSDDIIFLVSITLAPTFIQSTMHFLKVKPNKYYSGPRKLPLRLERKKIEMT